MERTLPLRLQKQINNDMLVDSDYDDKQADVAIITPDDDSMDDQSQDPLADNFEAMRERWMPHDPDLDVESETIHTWDIKEWRNLPKRSHGPVFQCGKDPWRILFFPAGNNASEAVSFYLEQGYPEDQKPPENWYACVRFMLVLWNPNDPSIYIHHEANHRFTADEGDWGFTRFAEKNKVFAANFEGKNRPLVENDGAKMTAYVRVLKDPTGVLWHNFVNYDSKKETNMVGLRNQGATCYLNSLLQSLYFTNAFRKVMMFLPLIFRSSLTHIAGRVSNTHRERARCRQQQCMGSTTPLLQAPNRSTGRVDHGTHSILWLGVTPSL